MKIQLTDTKKEIIKWSVYWAFFIVVYIVLSVVFGNYGFYALILVLAALNFIVRLALIYPFKKLQIKWLKYTIIAVLNLAILGGLAGLLYAIIVSGTDYNEKYIDSLDYSVFEHTSEYSYDYDTGVYTVSSKNDECKVLQLTDIHICASVNTISTDRKAFDACYEIIKEAQPDLIIVTGDIVYPVPVQTFSNDNLEPMYQFCTFMNNVGIPWALTYGNHDTEAVAAYDSKTLSGLFNHFKSENAPMLYADKQPDIYGRYNSYIRVENNDGTLNRVIFLIDSNDYVHGANKLNVYDSVHEDQIQWYSDTLDALEKENGAPVKSFVYMHIPFNAFAEAKALLDANSTEVKYLFGSNGEGVSCPKNDSGFFDKIVEKGSTQAVFVGHDHLNNTGVNYKGVDLVYGKSIDYIAYPNIANITGQRGGTIVTLSKSGEYSISQINYEK